MYRLFLATCLVLAAGLCTAFPAHARQEVQVALDREDRVLVVDARLAHRIGLFVDQYPGFQEARLFLHAADSTYALDVTTLVDGRTVRHRVPLTAAQVAELRDDVSGRIAARSPAIGLDQEGRHRLLGTTALLGLAFYGWAVPYVLDINHGGTAVGVYMLTAGTSFFGPLLLTRDRAVTRGMADLAGYGATRGIIHGLLAHTVISGTDNGDDFFEEDDDRAAVATAFAFSAAEGLGGYIWARNGELRLAQTRTIKLAGDLGMLHGLGLTVLADLDGRAAAGLVLAGAGAGIAVGRAFADRRDYSAGDVTVLSTASYLGAFGAAALVDLTGSDNDRAYAAGAMLGNLAGLAIGDRLVRPTEFTEGQGRLVALGTLAGGAIGAGIAYLIAGEPDDDDSAVYFNASALGAAAGFGLTYRGLAGDARRPGLQRSGLRIQLQPAALAALATGAGNAASNRRAVPLLTGSYRF